MMKLQVMDTLHKTDLHSKIARLSRRNTGLKQSENSPLSFLPGPRTAGFFHECEHTEINQGVELALQKHRRTSALLLGHFVSLPWVNLVSCNLS